MNTLIRWYREGADVQARLPLLSTWLGTSSDRIDAIELEDSLHRGLPSEQFPAPTSREKRRSSSAYRKCDGKSVQEALQTVAGC